ncbi:MAG: hypothetical protein JSS66_03470 [Armatimonadetes bacterium]|nr:hypothetical protein [Armatimonadota bacterium]
MAPRVPLVYTFGNHMHWVDMEWLWGYHVLPGSVRDMLAYCRQTGAKGCVNFDGIGYEKMASEAPEALAELRKAVQEGVIEPVGCSYGQPYGLFHGGESNIRQRIFGVRSVMRLLGVRPRTFWEEEFDFFPQLPQMLRGVGFTGASLYFQWTWHTPEVPVEASPVVWWEGIDGSHLICASRNRMNLHQWPEDFQMLLDELAEFGTEEVLRRGTDLSRGASDGSPSVTPLILQWLELMPSPDWMCRSELMVPKLKELLADERFEVKFATLGEYLSGVPSIDLANGSATSGERARGGDIPVRQYGLDDVWHGMSLGKNGDSMPKACLHAECDLLTLESIAAVMGLFGRPYADWDVYPVWELEEHWRTLLAAQHHDNHECEGLCGHVAKAQLAQLPGVMEARERISFLAKRAPLGERETLVFHPWGWAGPAPVVVQEGQYVEAVPSIGYVCTPLAHGHGEVWSVSTNRHVANSGSVEAEVDILSGRLTALANPALGNLVAEPGWPTAAWRDLSGAERALGLESEVKLENVYFEPPVTVAVSQYSDEGSWSWEVRPLLHIDGFELEVESTAPPYPDLKGHWFLPGFRGCIRLGWPVTFALADVFADHAYGVSRLEGTSNGKRKYPEGDWMTSVQWFEDVAGAFTSQSFVDLVAPDGHGLLIAHSGSQQWFRDEKGVQCVLDLRDPWDGENVELQARTRFWLVPHGPWANSDRIRAAWPIRNGGSAWFKASTVSHFHAAHKPLLPTLPQAFSAVSCAQSNVIPTALYRESEDYAGRDLEAYAGRGMGYPYVLRLVEFDGLESDVDLTIAGPVAKVYKTNLLGEIEAELKPERGDDTKLTPDPAQLKPFGIEAARLRFNMRPYEIATLYLDIVPGRKQFRDLDAKREVWATVHRPQS